MKANIVFILGFLLASAAFAQSDIPDDRVLETFVAECGVFTAAFPDISIPCGDFAEGKSPATLRVYLTWIQTGKAQLMALGPTIAQELLKSCLANAASEKPDPSGLLFCINMRKKGNDLEKLAKPGGGSLPDYGRLASDTVEPVPQYPSEDTQQAAAQRAEVRKQLVYSCIEQSTDYVQAICTAVAVHEIFAERPFGDDGELAKAFDKVVQVYVVTQAPQLLIREEAREALLRANINDQVVNAIVNPQEGAVEGVKHVVEEVRKILPEVHLPEVKIELPHW